MQFHSIRLNEYSIEKVGHSREYFEQRQILLDCRGEISIHPSSHFGFRVCILTSSHDISEGSMGDVLEKKVIIGEGAWICSGSILYNCEIGDFAVVGAGAVVKNMTVPPHTLVEGNPARVVAVYKDNTWERVDGRDSSGHS